MGQAECGRAQDDMRAAVGYRTQECDQNSVLSCESLGEEEEILPSILASASGIQATDKSASGRDGQVKSHSALKILQQQLKSFQALRQQTLQNVSMVQYEISEILNKNVADVKNPDFNLSHLPLASTPVNNAMPREYQEASHVKKQLHLRKDPGTTQCQGIYSNPVFGNTVTSENTRQILLKCQGIGKAEKHAQTCRNKAILSLNNEHNPKNSVNSIFSPSCIDLERKGMLLCSEIKKDDESSVSMAFHKSDNEDDEHLTESVSFSFKDMKEDCKKTPRHDLSYFFEPQNSPNVLCGKDNDSGYLSEQDLTEKATDVSNEEIKSRKISELEDSGDVLPIAKVSSKGIIPRARETESKSKQQNKNIFIQGNALDKFKLNFLSKVVEDKLQIPELTGETKKGKQKQVLTTQQEFQKYEDLKFCDADIVSDDCAKKDRPLLMSQRESGHLQKNVIDPEHEKMDFRKQITPVSDIIQSLTEQNLKYQKQIKDLHDEKNNIMGKLVKSDGDCKECLKEVKRLLKKCKELQQQKLTLEEKQDELYAQNRRMMQNLDYFQKKDQKAQECLSTLAQEKGNLAEDLDTLRSKISACQEENKKLGGEICQLTDNKSLLEQKLVEKQNEIEQVKDKEKTAVSDLESLLKMTQLLKDEKLDLDKTLQEMLHAKEGLQKELQEAQTGKANVEGKLVTECKNSRMEIGVLKTNLSNVERECERLRTVVEDITEESWVIKKDLHENKQEALECKTKIRRLNEELLLMENKMRTTENERDVLQLEVHRLRRNTANLRQQLTALVKERYKIYSSKRQGQPSDSADICEEILDYQHYALVRDPPECGKIADIRRKLEEEELYVEKRRNNGKQLYTAFSVSCTTSVIQQSGFQTAARKKYRTLCFAT